MKRFFSISFMLLFISLLTTECHKKSQKTTEYIPSELKDYALFQPGSFWIYKNENTGNIDSTFISKKPEFIYYSASYDNNTITELCQVFYEGPFLSTTNLSPSTYHIIFPDYSFEAINPISFKPDQIFELDGATTLKYFPLVDSMKIGNNTFYDIFITQWQFVSLQHDTTTNTCYFVKKVGLIKFNHKAPTSDSTWNILRFHVLQ
jgi:hypothetical protein